MPSGLSSPERPSESLGRPDSVSRYVDGILGGGVSQETSGDTGLLRDPPSLLGDPTVSRDTWTVSWEAASLKRPLGMRVSGEFTVSPGRYRTDGRDIHPAAF